MHSFNSASLDLLEITRAWIAVSSSVMGNFLSADRVLDKETVAIYAELTFLTKSEIYHIAKLLDAVNPGKLRQNLHHRFTAEEIDSIFPQIRCNPYRDSIYRVFSSKNDGRLSLEDVLDLCSAFSENSFKDVQASWMFRVFDFDDDNEISVDDLIEAVQRLTRIEEDKYRGIDEEEAEHVARKVLQEMVFSETGTISCEEFTRFASRISDFWATLQFRI